MQIKLYKPEVFAEGLSGRNCETRYYPLRSDLTDKTRCYVICDGLGENDWGEDIAEVFAKEIHNILMDTRDVPDIISRARAYEAVKVASTVFDYAMSDRESHETEEVSMACLYKGANGVLCIHSGKSTIYQVRPGQGVVYSTLEATHENVLELATYYKPELDLLTDIQGGDYFLICSQEPNESFNETTICEVLNETAGDEEKWRALRKLCKEAEKDDLALYFIPVKSVSDWPLETPDIEPKTRFASLPTKPAQNRKRYGIHHRRRRRRRKISKMLLFLIAVAAVLGVISLFVLWK